MTQYVVGLIFDESFENILLIRKNRPDWQKGRLNGVGGKVEKQETSYEAMVRECEEECGLLLYNWLLVENFSDSNSYEVHFFITQTPSLRKAYAKTDEHIEIHNIKELFEKHFGMDVIIYPTNALILNYYKKWSTDLC